MSEVIEAQEVEFTLEQKIDWLMDKVQDIYAVIAPLGEIMASMGMAGGADTAALMAQFGMT